jgi:hypothetical protein
MFSPLSASRQFTEYHIRPVKIIKLRNSGAGADYIGEMVPQGCKRIAAYIAGAPAINPASGAPGPREIVSPGFYFPIEELACGARPGPGKVWIRHQNCVCYEVDKRALAKASNPLRVNRRRAITRAMAA